MRVVGLALLGGFLAITAWSAGLVPASCCAPTCETCPVTVCSPAAADPPSKVKLARVAETVGFVAPVLPASIFSAGLRTSLPSFAQHAIRPPMRN